MTSRGVMVTALGGAVLGGCVNIPAFQGGDAGGDANRDAPGDGNTDTPAVSIVQSGNDVIAKAPGYALTFGPDGSRFPYQLDASGNLLMGGSQQCADEQAMGIALYPVLRINGAGSALQGAPVLTIPLDGPWVGQVRIGWTGSFPCTTGSGSLSGHTTFSIFPDGRFTRFDYIQSGAARNVADCTVCSGGSSSSEFVLTTYTTLIVDNGAYLSDGNLGTLTTYGAEYTTPQSTACVRERQQAIAFSWTSAANRLRVADDAPSRTIAFVHDIFRGATLPADGWATTTQMGVSATQDCGQLEARINPFSADDHQLMINGNPLGAALADGIYGGDPRSTGYPVDFPVTLTPAATAAPRIPAGFAVWLYSNPIPATLTLTHSGNPTGPWYRVQRVGSDQLVLWFEVGLDTGETITISGS